jgi:putative SOS response-associated peptidase YedK
MYEDKQDLADRFEVDEVVLADVPPRWNVAPTQPVVTIASSRDGQTRRLGAMRWGLVPNWAKDPTSGNRMINARADTLRTSKAFAKAFLTRRCIIPASGFYEWQKIDAGPGRRPTRRPFYVHTGDGQPLALAGLWEVWYDAEDRPLRSCTIITTEPNDVVASVHDRMPVVLARETWDRWLAPEALTDAEGAAMLAPAPADLLLLTEVSSAVNSPANDGPELVEPVADEGPELVEPVLG